MTLRRMWIAAVIASVLTGQSALAAAEEQREPPVKTAAPAVSSRPAMLMTVGGTVADLLTTLSVVNSGAGREINPILGESPAQIIAVKSALLVPQLLAERHLAKHGHPKAAMWLGIALGGLGTAMAIHNMQVGH